MGMHLLQRQPGHRVAWPPPGWPRVPRGCRGGDALRSCSDMRRHTQLLTPASACPIMPEEQRHVAPWQRLTIYRYTLPPPYEATEHLFEELPLSTYPSGTTMEPLAYEMAPGAHLGRAAPWTQALVLFPRREPPGMAGARASGVSFREACNRGYLRPYAPQQVPDS